MADYQSLKPQVSAPTFTKGSDIPTPGDPTPEVTTLLTGTLKSGTGGQVNLRGAKQVHYGDAPPSIPVNSDPRTPPQ